MFHYICFLLKLESLFSSLTDDHQEDTLETISYVNPDTNHKTNNLNSRFLMDNQSTSFINSDVLLSSTINSYDQNIRNNLDFCDNGSNFKFTNSTEYFEPLFGFQKDDFIYQSTETGCDTEDIYNIDNLFNNDSVDLDDEAQNNSMDETTTGIKNNQEQYEEQEECDKNDEPKLQSKNNTNDVDEFSNNQSIKRCTTRINKRKGGAEHPFESKRKKINGDRKSKTYTIKNVSDRQICQDSLFKTGSIRSSSLYSISNTYTEEEKHPNGQETLNISKTTNKINSEDVNEKTGDGFHENLNSFYLQISENVMLLKNVDFSDRIKNENLFLDTGILDKELELCQEINNLHGNYLNSRDYDLLSFESLKYQDTNFHDIVCLFEKKVLEIEKNINETRIFNLSSITEKISSLNIFFNSFFEELPLKTCFTATTPYVYYEFIKIIYDIYKDPLFSVILPEFSTFRLQNYIKFLRFVEKVDILDIYKFKLILKTYNFLFIKIKKMEKETSKISISIFVFNSRYYLRRYLICCLSTIWDSNILKLYMRITCLNIGKNIGKIEHCDFLDIRHINISNNKLEESYRKGYDKKEFIIRLLFQMDIDEFKMSVQLMIGKNPRNFLWDGFFFFLLFTKTRRRLSFSLLFSKDSRVSSLYLYFLRTLKSYSEENADLVLYVLKSADLDKDKNIDIFIQKNIKKHVESNIELNFSPDELDNFKNNIVNYRKFFINYEDERIRSLFE